MYCNWEIYIAQYYTNQRRSQCKRPQENKAVLKQRQDAGRLLGAIRES